MYVVCLSNSLFYKEIAPRITSIPQDFREMSGPGGACASPGEQLAAQLFWSGRPGIFRHGSEFPVTVDVLGGHHDGSDRMF